MCLETTPAMLAQDDTAHDLDALYRESNIGDTLEALDRELIGLAPVKRRVREIAALLLVEKLRRSVGLEANPPPLHMCFTGNPGTGKTTVAMRMASLLHGLGYTRKGHLVAVTRDDLVGQYIGHTAPKTKEVLKRAMGGVLFVDEAYYLYRPENERDYGQEAIEILLQVMENQREDIVVILAGYKDRMERFFSSNPGMASRVAHHIDFPDYDDDELFAIAELMLEKMNYQLDDDAAAAMREYIKLRRSQPRFSNARSIRNALDRARLRHANRLFEGRGVALSRKLLVTIAAEDIRSSRVFSGGGNLMELRALIFDVDGTLADTEDVHRRAFNAAFVEHGLTWNWGRRVYCNLLQTAGGKERILEFVSRLHLQPAEKERLVALVPALHCSKTIHYGRLLESGMELRPAVARLLQEAREAGLKLAVATTTTPANVERLVKAACGTYACELFDVIASGDVVMRKKPAPDIYRHALACLELPALACIAFEDSAIGLRAAKEAGLFTVVTPTQWTNLDDFKRADVRLDDLGAAGGLAFLKKAHSACLLKAVQAA
jgi:probable Rubsico expression protein CbbX